MNPPDTLGEKYHPLQAVAHINYWKGMACLQMGDAAQAQAYFKESAEEEGDFVEMSVSSYSELTYFRFLSLQQLNKQEEAQALLEAMKRYAITKMAQEVTIDYFATSLPLMLVFDDDIQLRNTIDAKYLLALAERGLGNKDASEKLLKEINAMNTMHQGAKDFLLTSEV